MTLKKKTISAIGWSGADLLSRRVVQLVVSITLARLLSPVEFGTVAVLFIFIEIANTFVDSGFSSAIIQKKEITSQDLSTVFWINLIVGLTSALILYSSSGLIAAFFKLPILASISKVLSINIIFGAVGAIHNTLFIKALNFKVLMKISLITNIFSGVIAIVLAMKGFGVWALVTQIVVSAFLTNALLWRYSTWCPSFIFSFASADRLFRFGSYLLLSGILDTLYRRAYAILLGRLYSVKELGYYNRAEGTKELPVGLLSGVLSKVAFPLFSEINDDLNRLKRGVRLAIGSMMVINIPVMFGLLVTAESVVLILFGDQWLPSVPILRVLCLGGMLWPLHVVNINVLKAQGYSSLFFRLEIIKKAAGVTFLVIGVQFGVMGIAWSTFAAGISAFFINSYYTGVYLDYGALRQIKDIFPTVMVSVAMAIIMWLIGDISFNSIAFQLLAQLIGGSCMFFFLIWIFKVRAVFDFYNILRN